MSHFDVAAIDIRSYLLSAITASGIVSIITYPVTFDSKIPVIPIQQAPEINNEIGDKPYIVYDMEIGPVDTKFWELSEYITFYIYGVDYAKVLALQSLIVDLFRRYELSAQDINVYCHSTNNFMYTSVEDADPPTAPLNEAGRIEASVQIGYKYHKAIDSRGRFAF